jgi:hypothetical protein
MPRRGDMEAVQIAARSAGKAPGADRHSRARRTRSGTSSTLPGVSGVCTGDSAHFTTFIEDNPNRVRKDVGVRRRVALCAADASKVDVPRHDWAWALLPQSGGGNYSSPRAIGMLGVLKHEQ